MHLLGNADGWDIRLVPFLWRPTIWLPTLHPNSSANQHPTSMLAWLRRHKTNVVNPEQIYIKQLGKRVTWVNMTKLIGEGRTLECINNKRIAGCIYLVQGKCGILQHLFHWPSAPWTEEHSSLLTLSDNRSPIISLFLINEQINGIQLGGQLVKHPIWC